MKTLLTLFLILIISFSGRPRSAPQQIISTIASDSLEYFTEAKKGDRLVGLLIDAKKKCDAENKILRVENARLKAHPIHDTIYIKRKFFHFIIKQKQK